MGVCKMDNISNSANSADQLLRIKDVVALTTLSKSCINLWVAQKRFPKPLTLSSTIKVWRSCDIADWIELKFDREFSERTTHTPVHPESASDQARTAIGDQNARGAK